MFLKYCFVHGKFKRDNDADHNVQTVLDRFTTRGNNAYEKGS